MAQPSLWVVSGLIVIPDPTPNMPHHRALGASALDVMPPPENLRRKPDDASGFRLAIRTPTRSARPQR